MKIFIVSTPDAELAPFITLKNAYKEMEKHKEYFAGQDFPTLKEIEQRYEERKLQGKDLYYRISTPDDVWNLHIEEFTLNP